MRPWCIISCFISLLSFSVVADSGSPSCPPTQHDALLRLRNSISPRLPLIACLKGWCDRTTSWNEDTDCCSWDGVACNSLTGDVIGLDLSCSQLRGAIYSNSSLFSLHSLQRLNLSYNSLEMPSPMPGMLFANLTNLEELDLSSNFLEVFSELYSYFPDEHLSSFFTSSLRLHDSLWQGNLLHYVFQLPNLRKLDLSGNGLNGTLPGSNWSSNLSYLDLSWNKFSDQVNLVKLSSLKYLRFLGLSGLSVSGEHADEGNHKLLMLETMIISSGKLKNFPCILSITPGLRMLDLSYSVLEEAPGQCDHELIVLPRLDELDMTECSYRKFPSFLSQSMELRSLFLNYNMIKEIPSWFWGIGIDTLEELHVENNLMQGRVRLPWKRLTYLNLQNNSFEGPLPTPAQSIKEFHASLNQFEGSIPPSICQLISLERLKLSGNNLTGIVPRCLGDLTSLRILDLSKNMLTGPLPRSLVDCLSLIHLDVSQNNFNGTPVAWLPVDSLSHMSLRDNSFEGQWPVDIFLRATSLWSIDLSGNKFEGDPPPPSTATERYSISSNNFSGDISPFICNAAWLKLLDMSNNSFTGILPESLKNTTANLVFLNLRMNKFHGVIPEIFSEGNSLKFLDLSRNQFEGALPRTLLTCTELELLNVGGNRIEDSFPYWLQALPLKVLSLRSNGFFGDLNNSAENIQFSQLRILDLSDNEFEGRLLENLIAGLSTMARADNISGIWNNYMIAQEYYTLEINLKGKERLLVKINVWFTALDLSSNRFHGELPGNLGSLLSLKGLNLSNNQLTGLIPPSLGNITYLDSLDLSSNRLVGGIPKELVRLSFLGTLNLSKNNLTGKIPLGGQFDTFSPGCFEGNPGLCGFPLPKGCGIRGGTGPQLPPSERRDDREDDSWSWSEWKFMATGFASGTVTGISLGYIVLEIGRPLWLARMVLRIETKFKSKSKKKAWWRK